MSLKSRFLKMKDDYVIHQVQRLQIPEFAEEEVSRYQVTFSGRVQKVGFRLEVYELADRLNLTGSCINLENGDVQAELQGPKEKIKFLVYFMESLKRIKVTNRTVKRLPVIPEETEFIRER